MGKIFTNPMFVALSKMDSSYKYQTKSHSLIGV